MNENNTANDTTTLLLIIGGLGFLAFNEFYKTLSNADFILIMALMISTIGMAGMIYWEFFSKPGKEKRERKKQIKELPASLLSLNGDGVYMGRDLDLDIPVHLPDALRSRHIHILGATGSGKTESVILNFLRQDVSRGLGAIILDAKGDISFLDSLKAWVPEEKLKIFDLGSESSQTYNPLEAGNPLESAQRLFSSLTWSEEYYKSKAFSALQRIFQIHFERFKKNPTLLEVSDYLKNPDSIGFLFEGMGYPKNQKEKDFSELSGLRDQIKSLCTGYLAKTLSPKVSSDLRLQDAKDGSVLYFRLQSLMSPQLVATLGKLVINHLNYMAGTAHREENEKQSMIPTYLDEFASFACPEFADLISKARSAGIALHFSHQSIGDLAEVSKGFLNRITDNSATKIVLRINDPDSADFFARSFGTKLYQKVTQRITNAKDLDSAEVMEDGTRREAHQFRASPDTLKTHPTGVGSVLIAHGYDTPHGASSVFKIKFPFLREEKLV